MWKKNVVLILVTCQVAFAPASSISQDDLKLKIGDQVRVEYSEKREQGEQRKTVRGIVVEIGGPYIGISNFGSPSVLWLEIQNIHQLEVKTGDSRSKGEGAAMGAAAGFGLAFLWGALSGNEHPDSAVPLTWEGKALFLSALFVPLGALVGAGTATDEKWELQPLGGMVVGFQATPKGSFGLLFTARF